MPRPLASMVFGSALGALCGARRAMRLGISIQAIRFEQFVFVALLIFVHLHSPAHETVDITPPRKATRSQSHPLELRRVDDDQDEGRPV